LTSTFSLYWRYIVVGNTSLLLDLPSPHHLTPSAWHVLSKLVCKVYEFNIVYFCEKKNEFSSRSKTLYNHIEIIIYYFQTSWRWRLVNNLLHSLRHHYVIIIGAHPLFIKKYAFAFRHVVLNNRITAVSSGQCKPKNNYYNTDLNRFVRHFQYNNNNISIIDNVLGIV